MSHVFDTAALCEHRREPSGPSVIYFGSSLALVAHDAAGIGAGLARAAIVGAGEAGDREAPGRLHCSAFNTSPVPGKEEG